MNRFLRRLMLVFFATTLGAVLLFSLPIMMFIMLGLGWLFGDADPWHDALYMGRETVTEMRDGLIKSWNR